MTEYARPETVLSTLLSLLLLWGLMGWLYPDYRVDVFRQQMFALRDELFDYARAGNIAFEHPAYVMLRETAHDFIRRAERLGVLSTVLAALEGECLTGALSERSHRRWHCALDSLDEPRREQLNEFRTRMYALAMTHVGGERPTAAAHRVPLDRDCRPTSTLAPYAPCVCRACRSRWQPAECPRRVLSPCGNQRRRSGPSRPATRRTGHEDVGATRRVARSSAMSPRPVVSCLPPPLPLRSDHEKAQDDVPS